MTIRILVAKQSLGLRVAKGFTMRPMSIVGFLFVALAALPAIGGCDNSEVSETRNTAIVAPENPTIEVVATAISEDEVEFTVTTNIPTPVEVMASVDLTGQAPDDIYIGYSDRVTLTGPTTTFILNTSEAREPLPDSEYDAEVSFYSRWGAEKNEAARGVPDTSGSQRVQLKGSGATREAEVKRRDLQKWVMLNIVPGYPWSEGGFRERLGRYETHPVTRLNHHTAYYYPEADMTLLVNELRNEISVWRMGLATE